MITESRQLLRAALTPIGWDVYDVEPSNVDLVPCVVVGRPSMEIQASFYTITHPVWVIGSRLGDEDAAHELDEVTDRAVELLRAATVLTVLQPGMRAIAENTYPAYRIDCVTGQGVC
jgi:hypothetical protein